MSFHLSAEQRHAAALKAAATRKSRGEVSSFPPRSAASRSASARKAAATRAARGEKPFGGKHRPKTAHPHAAKPRTAQQTAITAAPAARAPHVRKATLAAHHAAHKTRVIHTSGKHIHSATRSRLRHL